MMNWLYYLLEVNIYLTVFYALYRLLLHRETFYTLSRYYLILSSITAFGLPLIQIGYLHPFIQEQTEAVSMVISAQPATNKYLSAAMIVPFVYIITAFGFSLKMIANLTSIILYFLRSNKERKGEVIYIKLKGSETAFSFFNLLFINPSAEGNDTILTHEMVHIRQKHSVDILFFEIIQLLNWFNPCTYFMKKDVKLIHEYIADEETTNTNIQKHDYAMFLIQNSFGVIPNQLTNQIFNQSVLKRRINMLNKKRSSGTTKLRLLLVLPVLGGMLCTSSMAFTKDYAVLDLYPGQQETTKQEPVKKKENAKKFPPPIVRSSKSDTTKDGKVRFPPPIVRKDNVPAPPQPPKSDPRFPPPIVREGPVKPKKSVKRSPVPALPPAPPSSRVSIPPPAVDKSPKKDQINSFEGEPTELTIVQGYRSEPNSDNTKKEVTSRVQIVAKPSKDNLKEVTVRGIKTENIKPAKAEEIKNVTIKASKN